MLTLRSKITRAVLNYFLLEDGKELFVNEMARRFSLDSGNLTHKLGALEKEGLLKSRWQGNQRLYSLNHQYPLLKEYKNIILKTVGLESLLKKSLQKIPGITRALIFGSYASDKMDLNSDIDLLVVGGHDTIALHKAIAGVQKTLDREINVISMGQKEYESKKNKKGVFFGSVGTGKYISIL